MEKASGKIRYVSENAANLLGEGPDDLLDLDGKDWLEQNLPALVSWPASAGRRMHFPSGVDMGQGELDVAEAAGGDLGLTDSDGLKPVLQVLNAPAQKRALRCWSKNLDRMPNRLPSKNRQTQLHKPK